MRILSIGNSFSQDAQRYLHEIAEVNGEKLKCVNLHIGGCSLRQHYLNMLDNEAKYLFEFNGSATGIYVSIKDALKSDNWDVVTLQQASHESFCFDSYTPYLENIFDYVKKYSPKSKIYIHKTWAYPDNRQRLFDMGYQSTEEMFKDVNEAYKKACDIINADGIIPSGDAMLEAYIANPDIVYRDPIHASLGFGRYLLGLVWFFRLFGRKENFEHIENFSEPVSPENKITAYKIACAVNTREGY